MRVAESIDTSLRTACGVVALPAALIFYSAGVIALALLGAKPARVHRLYVGLARFCTRVAGTELEIHGIGHVRPGQAYIVVPNHESNWDPVCLMVALPELVMRFVAKQEILRIPVLGQAMRLTGNVRVVRTQTKGDVERIRAAMDRRAPGVSILFFAEGTRSRDGSLQPFKMGAFTTAIGYGLPILPIGIAGTRPIWKRGFIRLRKGTAVIQVGASISSEGLRIEDCERLRDRTFAVVAELRTRARQHLREMGVDPGGID